MSRSFIVTFYLIVAVFTMLFGYLYIQIQYEAVKKFYPNLTFWECAILGSKLRITPNGE